MPTDPVRTRILSVANQKGGVGKTTTTVNLAAALAEKGQSILVIDLDPQGNASTGLGISPTDRDVTTYDFLMSDATPQEAIRRTNVKNLDIVPATTDLSSADLDLISAENRSFLLHDAIRQPRMMALGYNYILIDCPPSLSLLTLNALVASDAVLVPLQAEFYALEGLSQLMLTVRDVRQSANPSLRIEGIVLTMFDTRNRLSKQVEADARDNLGDMVLTTRIPRNVRLSEAPSFALPILEYDSASKGAEAYRGLATELLQRHATENEPEMADE